MPTWDIDVRSQVFSAITAAEHEDLQKSIRDAFGKSWVPLTAAILVGLGIVLQTWGSLLSAAGR